jgi:NAD(P)H-quinone oxidoreductase subunit 5
MSYTSCQPLVAGLAAAGPLALLVFGLQPASSLNREGVRAARRGATVSLVALGFALAAVVARILYGAVDCSLEIAGPFRLGVYFDNLSAIVLTLVAFLLAVVMRYSVNYLAGDPEQGRFTRWLCLTGGSVLAIVISGNLIQFALAWSATSLCLHRLLVFYRDRPGAVLAARKKFIISRLGDSCLLTVIILVYREFHTWDFSALFAAARQVHEAGNAGVNPQIHAICFLLVAGAMLKSAQFPFHSWLPDTMETPTPVSALMHAGIINAGGFLIIRLNPLITLSPAALSALALFGTFTALFASLVMLTHASVKRSLAFSTIAQMGFMMLECGLGAFGLAVLHLVAHSLYKAHAFLSSGSIVRLAKAAWTPTEKPIAHPIKLVGALAAAVVLTLASAHLAGIDSHRDPGFVVLGSVFAMALTSALWNLWARSFSVPLGAFALMLGGGIVTAYFALHKLFGALVGNPEWVNSQLDSGPGRVVLATLLGLFLLVLIIQTVLPQWANRPVFRAIYVHARNGFYFNTLANRSVAALWPVKKQSLKH